MPDGRAQASDGFLPLAQAEAADGVQAQARAAGAEVACGAAACAVHA
eukprot:CAMPEP_0197593000 /NCGR_PEP_ID=MMETSP1326-20131121/16815_1 /TAXON_ID=1155430 /ORGANISM="Genus nov. species nov., Strain RCC2288" /LENGTH=46 /DNA_ID= /DNA_START= /DNA_END= /DNA_ORIENTATION=